MSNSSKADIANHPKPQRQERSRTPLKSIPYEQTANGALPQRVSAPGQVDDSNSPSSPASSKRASRLIAASPPKSNHNNSSPPRWAPSLRSKRPSDRASVLSNEIKRDSGFATSISTGGSPSVRYAESRLSSTTMATVAGAAREPSLPTIIVHDEEGSGGNSTPVGDRSLSTDALPRPSSAEGEAHEAQPMSPPPRSPSRRPSRSESSLEQLGTVLPSSNIDDINLEDLATDKVGFSKRGSILFGGKKMNKLLSEAQHATAGQSQLATRSSVSLPTTRSVREETAQMSSVGLQAARRRADTQVQQADSSSERVLSAEEVTFSQRVRSMYEHGDERAPDWSLGAGNRAHLPPSPRTDGPPRDTPTPEAGALPLTVEKRRSYVGGQPAPSPRHSYYAKEPTELAGGIEDWEDVDGHDVDRYGFISPSIDRAFSRESDAATLEHGAAGLHRVATALRLEADQPRRERKLKRRASNARSSRSAPPRPASRLSTVNKPAGSVHSIRSTASTARTSVFRSREKRLLGEASDMLTLPPGLADIAEHEDAGRTASMLKQREWAREQKWQRMARPVRERNSTIGARGSVGGGMRFDFDTHDPKLVSRTWKGIPDRWRATAWHSFLSASARARQSPASDEELVGQFHKLQALSCADDGQIDVDVPRTISRHIMFRRRYRGGQRLLFRVLHAVSLYFPGTGYVQGMASLAATLLCYFDEERAFVMLVRLWQLRGLEQLFQPGFGGLMTALADFEQHWLAGGDVSRRLEELGVSSTAYGTRWYLTLFSMSVPFPAQLRIWDVFMLLGDLPTTPAGPAPSSPAGAFGGADLDVLHATSAALIDATREIILDSDFENAMKVLTSFVPIKDEDLLMRVARTEWKMKRSRKS